MPSELLAGKIIHLALPVRWSPAGQEGRGSTEVACTYDIHADGARLLSLRPASLGDLLILERGRNKALCQVVWTADPASTLRGQFSVRCVASRAPWDEELQQMEEQYEPVLPSGSRGRAAGRAFVETEANRRRCPRFNVHGQAEMIDGVQRVSARIQQISEIGARISAAESWRPGADFRLMLNLLDVSLALKAQVKNRPENLGMGVEFHEIRRGDRPLLSYVLNKLKSRKFEELTPASPLVAAVG
jgi:PilZ domain